MSDFGLAPTSGPGFPKWAPPTKVVGGWARFGRRTEPSMGPLAGPLGPAFTGLEKRMTRPKTKEEFGVDGFKVRVVVDGAIIHVLSRTEPRVDASGRHVLGVEWDLITGTEHGDTVGFIRWESVSAISWRRA